MGSPITSRLQLLLSSVKEKLVRFTCHQQETLRKTLGHFNRLYAFLSHVVTFRDADLEKLFVFDGPDFATR